MYRMTGRGLKQIQVNQDLSSPYIGGLIGLISIMKLKIKPWEEWGVLCMGVGRQRS